MVSRVAGRPGPEREPMPVALPAWPDALRSRSLRIWSGTVLGLYLVTHFANIALGLASVAAMQGAAPLLATPWRSLPGTVLLAGALLIHFGLALRALYHRRTLRMGAREAAQIGLGLALPFLIVPHVAATRIEPALTGLAMTFADQVRTLWIASPAAGGRQGVALLVAWTHGCFGFWFALRGRPWFPRWTWALYAAALLVPVLAILGFAEAAREIAVLPAPVDPPRPASAGPSPEVIRALLYLGFAAPLAAMMGARSLRYWRGRHHRIRITYPEGRSVAVPRGSSVLEASRMGQIPHVSLCGGRGRCSTCRIRVMTGQDGLPPPAAQERHTLARSGAGSDMRLACQLRPLHDIAVMPLFAAPRPRVGEVAPRRGAASHERELAVLFCDLRGFTRRAEHWLPFDTVFMLNRYFEMVGEAVEASGGYLDKFIGDGALALFGLGTSSDVACRQALAAAAGVARGLQAMNAEFAAELGEPLRIAMGLHVGNTVVGDMGYGSATGLTAVGDGINVASRLEGEAKDRDVEAVVSAALLSRAGRPPARGAVHEIAIRGRDAPIDAVLVPDAARLDAQAEAALG